MCFVGFGGGGGLVALDWRFGGEVLTTNIIEEKMASYIGWFKHANCYSLLTKTIKHKELLDYLDIRKGNRTYE